MKNQKYNILVITPVKHIDGFEKTINKLGKVSFKEHINYEDLLKIINNFEIVFTNPNKSKIFFDKKLIDQASKLKYLCTASTGINHIDTKYLKKKGIKIISLTKNKKIINKISSTAEHSLALTLSALRKIPFSFEGVKNNEWNYENYIGRQMNYLSIGVIGAGRLGKFYINLCKNIFKEILVFDPYKNIKETIKVRQVNNLEYLFKKCDVISLHVHVSDETINLINEKLLSFAKANLILVNTSRGEIINEYDLIKFLKKNESSIYATDVLSNEIRGRQSNPIIKYAKNKKKQIIITQHIGGMTTEGQSIAYLGTLKSLKNNLI